MLQTLKRDQGVNEADISSEVTLSLKFLQQYQDFMISLETFYVIVAFALFGFYLLMTFMLILLILIQRNKVMKELSEKATFQQGFSALLIIFSKVLYIPFLELMVRAFIAFSNLSLGLYIGFSVINVFSLVTYIILIFYTKRILRLNMISDSVTWSQANPSTIYLGFLAKAMIPCVVALDYEGKYIYVEIIITMIIQIGFLFMIIMFTEFYDRRNDLIQKISQGIVVLVLEIGVIKYLFKDYDMKEGIYLLVLVVFQSYFIYSINKLRKDRLLNQFYEGKIKLELEYEYVLLYLLEIASNALLESDKSQEYYSEILKLIEMHQLKCANEDCICRKSDQFMDLFRIGYQQSSNVFLVQISQFKQIKKFIQDSTTSWQKNQQDEEEEKEGLAFDSNQIDLSHINVTVDQLQYQNQAVKKKKTTAKVDVQLVKQKYITNFLLIYFQEVQQKFPSSLRIQILCNYYSMFVVMKQQLCISQLRGQNDKNHSWLDRIAKLVNEYYILYNYEQREKQTQYENGASNLEGDHFIKINDLYQDFFNKIDTLSSDAAEFWKGFTVEQINVHKQYELGSKIAANITKSYQIFKEIEENLIYKDYKIYMLFGQLQLKIMNDQEGYNIFIQKTRGIIQMNKLFQSNMKGASKKFNEDSGFIIVDAHHSQFGRIQFMNKTLRRWLNRTDEEIKFLNITAFMPKQIAENHEEFVKKYNNTGESNILNRKVLLFMKDKYESIFPAEIFIKFHYSQKHSYSFIALVNQLKELTPYQDGLKYSLDQLIFMSVDLENGQIHEVSSNFLQLLQISGENQFRDIREISLTERVRSIGEIIIDFNIEEFQQSKMIRNNKSFYEGIHKLDLTSFNENIDGGGYATRQQRVDLEAKVAFYVESYNNGKFKVGYAVITLLKHQIIMDQDEKSLDYEMIQNNMEREQLAIQNDASSSVGSSNSGSSTSSINQFAQFHSFYKQQTPRILKIVIQLILLMFIVSTTIGTVNLVLNINNSAQSQFQVETVRQANDRVNQATSSRLTLRILLNMANGYEPMYSKVLPNRYDTYKELFHNASNKLREIQNFLDNSNYPFSDEFNAIRSQQNVPMSYLQFNMKILEENSTMRDAQSLFGGKLIQISSYTKDQLKGNLNLQTLRPNKSSSYRPTDQEQTIFFVIYNGNGVLRYFNIYFNELYLKDTTDNANNNLNQTQITTIISIVTIFIVACIISPIISKTEERKINALSFFLKMPKKQIEIFMQRSKTFQIFDSNLKQQSNGTLQTRSELLRRGSPNDGRFINDENVSYNKIYGDITVYDLQDRQNQESHLFFTTQNQLNYHGGQRHTISSQHHSQFGQDVMQDDDHDHNIVKELKTVKHSVREEGGRDGQPMNLSQINEESMEHEEGKSEEQKKDDKTILDNNLKSIARIAFRKKSFTLLLVMSVMFIFSLYFVISFFMAKQSYDSAANSSKDLNTIFGKEQCFEALINFMRENQIRNESLKMWGRENQTSSVFQLERCREQEQLYIELRKNLPSYLIDSESLMNSLEENNFCDTVYEGSYFKNKNENCKQALNGLLSKGLSNTLQYMLNQAQKIQLNFDSALISKSRTYEFLQGQMNDTETIELMDAKLYLMGRAFDMLKQSCMDSTTRFFSKLLTQFVIVYAIFLSLLIFALIYFMLFAFKRLRKIMWSTNMLLKIIPPNTLNKKDSEKLKQFFVN